MNFLAHAYLSFGHPEILAGNMVSDFVKGKKKFDYSAGIQKGFNLHRAIDAFTDAHPITKEAKVFLKPAAGAYAGAFIDVAYDHFLANDLNEFGEGQLQQTAQNTYAILNEYIAQLPPNFSQMIPYMIKENWLFNYSTLYGIEKSFWGLVRRAKYLDDAKDIFIGFKDNYRSLEKCYKSFFPALKIYSNSQLQLLLND